MGSIRNGVLLDAMQRWVSDHRKQPGSVGKEQVENFAQWIGERATLDQQTAALTGDSQALRDWHERLATLTQECDAFLREHSHVWSHIIIQPQKPDVETPQAA